MRDTASIETYAWVDDSAAYESLAFETSSTTVPVLRPASLERQARWASVLEWYGLGGPGRQAAAPSARADDVVVALDHDLGSVGRCLANRCGRPFLTATSSEALIERSRAANWKSALVLGRPEQFTGREVALLANGLSIPWGLLTAPDLAGFTFAVAKLLAPGRGRDGFALVDAVDASVSLGGLGQSDALDPARLNQLILDMDWRTLALYAHGEGGHVNLDSIVLCGLVGEVELGADGAPNAGCRVAASRRWCKRAPDPATRIVSFGEPRAEALHLFTCASSLMAGELYASNVSAVLSLADGYPRSALVTDRIVAIDRGLAAAALGLAQDGVGAGTLADLLNDLEVRQSGTRPYILFGDPAGPHPPATMVDRTGSLEHATRPVTQLPLGGWSGSQVLGLEEAPDGARLFRGAENLVLSLPGGEPSSRSRLADKTGQWHGLQELFVQVGRRLRSAAWLEQGIRRLYEPRIEASLEFRVAVDLLSRLRLQLETDVQLGLRACEAARQSGVWDTRLVELGEACARDVAQWDRHLAFLMAEYLFSGLVHLIPSDGFTEFEQRQGLACEHCASTLCEISARSPLDDQPERQLIECPLCGGRETWSTDSGRLVTRLSGPLRPGSAALLTVEFSAPENGPPAGLKPGVLVAQVQDKALRVFLRRCVVVDGRARAFEVCPPADLAPELHVLQLAWIHGLTVTIHRRRWPSLG